MKLTYNAADHTGFVDNDTTRGTFTQELELSFACDMLWYDPTAGLGFMGKGFGRCALTPEQCAEVETLIGTIALPG